jgi:zinc protease
MGRSLVRTAVGRVVLLLAALVPFPAAAQDPAAAIPRDSAVRAGILPNGLQYFIRANSRPERRAELRLVINAGSVLEDDDQLGLAHFVEHMAFNGTRRFAKQELIHYLESIGMRFGADLNAYTSFDQTVYQLQVPTDSVGVVRTAFEILEDWAHGIRFEGEEVERERGVVIEEWRGRRGADARIQDAQWPVIFGGSRYADRLPIGTVESLQGADSTRLIRFYRDWYRPDLTAVVAVGDFDPEVIEALIREHFSGLVMPAAPRPRPLYPVAPAAAPRATVVTDPEALETSVGALTILPSRDDRTIGAWRQALIEQILSRSLNGRLAELSQRADAPFLGAGGGRGSLVASADAWSLSALVQDSAVATGLEAALVEVERVRRLGITAGELDRARADILRGLEQLHTERDQRQSGEFAGALVNHYLFGQPVPSITWRFQMAGTLLPSITLEEANAVARAETLPGVPIVLVGAPAASATTLPAEANLLEIFGRVRARELAAYTEELDGQPLVPDPPAPGRIVRQQVDTILGVHDWTLSNGVRVLVKPTDFKDDQILVSGTSPGGLSRSGDPANLSSQFAAVVATQGGVGRFSATDLQKALAGKAVDVFPSIGLTEEGISGQVAPSDLETFLELVWLHFTAPRADSGSFQAFVQQARAYVQNRGASPDVAFQDTLQAVMWQGHPLSRPFTPDRVAELELSRALAFYRDRFADAGDFTFVFVGKVDPDLLRPLAERWLGALPAAGRDDAWRDLGMRRPDGVVRRQVRRGIEPVSQAAIFFHGPLEWSRAERFALDAAREVLNFRLRDALREALGATYGVSVSAGTQRIPRPEYTFSIQFSADPARIDSLVGVVFEEIGRLKESGATADEVGRITETRLREREVRLRENGFWLSLLEATARDGEPLAEALAEQEHLIRALTPEGVGAAARRYLDTTRYLQVTLYPEPARTP